MATDKSVVNAGRREEYKGVKCNRKIQKIYVLIEKIFILVDPCGSIHVV